MKKSSTAHQKKESLFERFVPNRSGIIIAFTAVLLNIVMWFLMYFFAKPDDYPLPLHYNIYQGIDLVDVWSRLYLIPIIGAAIIIINYALSTVIYKKDVFIASFLNITSVLVQVILVIALLWIFNLQKTLF
ncbi:hypothetical protein KKH43_06060 [Patescibacteria group bacterium]|nr:hypothetical protein [Patescibacteria group bacterium]